MRRFLRILRVLALLVLAVAAAVFVVNASQFAPAPAGKPRIIAHRGLGQTFHREDLTGTTCTAARIFPPEHPYLENTIAGFAAAFAAGADMVEFDVHPTTDGHFVVFHDWTLDCRTDGHGVTREHSLAELEALDIGYGYTADGGKTHPFRGQGIGLMPTLSEVLATDAAKRCLIRYELLGWLGIVPDECRSTLFMVPVNYARFAWGFPNRLTARLGAFGTTVVLLGPYDGSGFSSGIDDPSELAAVPARFDGMVWTNRIDLIGPALAGR
jgi:glycerophosphoryl diester phosphodiesterase